MDEVAQVPDKPWMPAEEVELLTKSLELASCFLEYGAGGSTILAGSIGVKHIYSVESDRAFLKNVESRLRSVSPNCDFREVYVNIGDTGRLGKPTGFERVQNWPKYSSFVWSVLMGSDNPLPDLVLVDGRFRVSSFLCSYYFSSPGTVILFDDYFERQRYHVVEDILVPIARAGRMAKFVVPVKKNMDLAFLSILNSVNDFS